MRIELKLDGEEIQKKVTEQTLEILNSKSYDFESSIKKQIDAHRMHFAHYFNNEIKSTIVKQIRKIIKDEYSKEIEYMVREGLKQNIPKIVNEHLDNMTMKDLGAQLK